MKHLEFLMSEESKIYSYVFPKAYFVFCFCTNLFQWITQKKDRRPGQITMHVLKKADLLFKMNALKAKL